MVETGNKAPEFTLTSDKGEEVSLSDFRGEPIVLYFYPKAGTTGCTKQACAIRDAFPKIETEDEDVTVIGISPDPPEALVKFREKHALPFVLLSDPDHEVAEAYSAWGEKKAFGTVREGVIRSHFAIDEEGRITERKHNVKPESTAELVLKITRF